jgi:hypothetical protein
VGIAASSTVGAGEATGLIDEPNRVKELEVAADATAEGVWCFLAFAAKCFFTSAFLISMMASPFLLLAYLTGHRLERSKES